MWNKRSDEPEPPRFPERNPEPPPRPQAAPPASPPQPAAPPNGMAVIGREMSVRGDIRSNEDLWVDGSVEGTLELPQHRLSVGPNGKVKANIRAREVVVMGNVQGNVEAREKVTIRKEARLVGDLRMAGIQIDDGAYFKGTIDILRPDMKPAPKEEDAPGAASRPALRPEPAPVVQTAVRK